MKDQAIEIAKYETSPRMARNKLREYLHHVILRKFFELNLTSKLVFHGGTALRILHGHRRFSEDLDFHLLQPNSDFEFRVYLTYLIKELQLSGYRITCKEDFNKVVQSVFVKFENLLYEANISHHKNEILSIKIEIDTKPPDGFTTNRALLNQYFPIAVLHHDKGSFIAGKVHAILQRAYVKGRDFFDLVFFLSRWKNIQPNFVYLNNALRQTNYTGSEVSENNWKDLLLNRIRSLDWNTIKEDVEPFIVQETDMQLLDRELIANLLKS